MSALKGFAMRFRARWSSALVGTLTSWVAVSASAAPSVTVTRLRCEYAENPLGIDVERPRLSWVLESPRRGEVQTAYQVLVASSPERLAAGAGDLWDSGRVASGQSVHIVYAGTALASGARAHWKARVWDRDGRPSEWSAPAWWEMGLLKPEDWKAKWIALDAPPPPKPAKPDLAGARWIWFPEGDPAAGAPAEERFFRRRIEVPAGRVVVRAAFLGTADDSFAIHVNGREVGRGTAWNQLFAIDVKDYLAPGANVLAIQAANGGGPAGLIGRLRVEFESGDPLVVATGKQWKAGNRRVPGWEAADFDDSAWPAARDVAPYGGGPWKELEAGGSKGPSLGPCPFLRKSFSLARPVRRARVYATALGLYELRLNGRRVGDDLLTPGWTDYHTRVPYQTYDVTDRLRPGENVLGIVLADGWYAGYVGWGQQRGHYGPRPYALAQVGIAYDDGGTDCVVTDGAWKAACGPLLASDFLMGETYDARRELPGWDAPGFDDAAWGPVVAPEVREGRLVAQVGPPIRRTQEIPATSVSEPAPGVFVFDLGQNMVGWARLKARGAAGTAVTLRFAEMLNPDKTLYVTNLRGAKATDRYVLKGGGEEVYEPRFTFHGFRYVEATGYPGRPPLDAVTGIVIHSDTPPCGTFECSHPMVNRLWRNVVWGQRGNFVSIPTDCPQRDERLGWMGDAQIFVRTATYNMDVAGFFTKWAIDVEDAQSPEGAFPDVSPRMPHKSDGAPAWGDAGVIVPWTIYRVYGDTRMLETHYGAMAKWIEYIRSANPDLLWTKRVNNNYGDWVSVPPEATPKEILSTAFFAYSTRLMARAAKALGRDGDARKYEELFEGIRAAFDKAFVDADGRIRGVPREAKDKGGRPVPRGDTQTCYVLALRFGLLPAERREAAARRLVELIEQNNGCLSTGFLGVGHLLPSLTDAGRADTAYALLLNDKFPSWFYSINHGATTIWERWDGWTEEKGFQDPGMNSFNHYSFGSVGEWLFSTVAGIDLDPETPGFKRVSVRPRPGGGLRYAKASYDSLHGRIESRWAIEGDRFVLDAVIPANATATVCVPAREGARVLEGGRPAEQAEGVKALGRRADAAAFEVGSGAYHWEVVGQ